MKGIFRLSVALVVLAAVSPSHATDQSWRNVYGTEAVKRQIDWLYKNEERKKQVKQIDLPNYKPEVKSCADVDIMDGMWKRIYFKESPESALYKSHKRQPHYYVTFTPEMFYGTLRSGVSIDDTNEALKLMYFNRTDKRPQKYELEYGEDNSKLILKMGDVPLYTYTCTIVTKASDIFVEGDMVLHGFTNNGNSMLYELYRRWF